MLAIEFRFPAGRYHATPWDRHVNEGAVAWPPEPWRILRGLVATWHHKVAHTGRHAESTLRDLIGLLARDLPEYRLPSASHAHVRHYMPQFGAGKKSLVLDAFAAVSRDDSLVVVWRDVELPPIQRDLLDDLLEAMAYLGRAESWVEARRIEEPPEADCVPGSKEVDEETGELLGEAVTLFAPVSPEEYAECRNRFLADGRAARKLARTLPDDFFDALCVDTADLRKAGWSQPPAARKVHYLRPVDALKPRRVVKTSRAPRATTACFILAGKPLPAIGETLRIGELLRAAVMSQARRRFGEDRIPAIFSGHDLPKDNRHGHAFYLPFDRDGDGRLDRLVVHVPHGMEQAEQRVLEALQRLCSREGDKWRVALEAMGGPEVVPDLAGAASAWRSVTPYLHPWHVKKRFTVEDQIRRECRERGLPEPEVMERMDGVALGDGRRLRASRFRRTRSRRGLVQPDRLGSFWRLVFPRPVEGPLALGFACHFGLGLFVPDGRGG